MNMKPVDRWIFIGIVLGWTAVVLITGYSMGSLSCAGASFGFY
jgi:hypothetical protein